MLPQVFYKRSGRGLCFVLFLAIAFPVFRAARRLNVDGVLTYVASAADRETRVTLARRGNRIVIIDDHTHSVVASAPADRVGHVVVRGVDGDHNDTLTVDFSNGLSLPGGIDYDGGAGGFDTLRVTGGSFAETRYAALNRNDGGVDVGNTQIRFRNLEPLTDTGHLPTSPKP